MQQMADRLAVSSHCTYLILSLPNLRMAENFSQRKIRWKWRGISSITYGHQFDVFMKNIKGRDSDITPADCKDVTIYF